MTVNGVCCTAFRNAMRVIIIHRDFFVYSFAYRLQKGACFPLKGVVTLGDYINYSYEVILLRPISLCLGNT
jgi:hypothetical protein